MFTQPLHHAYLVSSQSVTGGVSAVSEKLHELLDQTDTELIIDVDTIETLTIEQARQLRSRGQQKATGQAQCIIRGFDTATVPAQNALLKIVEDPSEGTHFFFVTTDPGSLLETVRSRVLQVENTKVDNDTQTATDLVKEFVAADTLPARLQIVEKLETNHALRQFISKLADTELARKNSAFGGALENAADWSRDSGASLKLLGQLLAVAANRSPSGK